MGVPDQGETVKKVSNALAASGNVNARLDARDIIAVNGKLTLVGVGLGSNELGAAIALKANAFGTDAVAIVKDVFDRDESRPYLSSVLGVNAAGVVILTTIFKPLLRRKVNHFTRIAGNDYLETQHDVCLATYLRTQFLRIIPASSTSQFESLLANPRAAQSTNHFFMVAPTAFVKNAQAALDNHFMNDVELSAEAVTEQQRARELQHVVLHEYSALYRALRDVGVQIHLFAHETFHDTPDAVFPNNWFSTHAAVETGLPDATLVLYPMKVPNRRQERRPELVQYLRTGLQRYVHVIDMVPAEEDASRPAFLEGTGCLVIDRVNRVAYVLLSERSDRQLAERWARQLNYEAILFHATDDQGRAIYHTNVMMAIGTSIAVICLECIPDAQERNAVKTKLESTGHTIIDITRAQVNKFCGNILEIESSEGKPMLAMSTQAFNGFTEAQRDTMREHVAALVHADISTIERVGGGGVRCTLAELF